MIQTIKRKKGTIYKARVELKNGSRLSKSFASYADAKKWERSTYAQRETINPDQLQLSKTKLNDFFQIWFKNKEAGLRPSTRQSYLSQYNLHIGPLFGEKRLEELRALDGDTLISSLQKKGNNPKGINVILTTFA